MSTDNISTLTPPNLNSAVDISGAPLSFELVHYKDESQLNEIIRLIHKDLSEPYSIYTYRYFLHNWPNLCFLVIKYIYYSYVCFDLFIVL
jgi:hypothetical protein